MPSRWSRSVRPTRLKAPAATARSRRSTPPALDVLARLLPAQDLAQGLLQQIGSVKRLVGPLDLAQLATLPLADVFGVLQQRPPRSLDRLREVTALGFAHHLTSNLVDRVVGQLLDVEAIEDDISLRGVLLNGELVSGGHVHGHRLEPQTGFWSDLGEESCQRLGALALAGPDDPTAIVIDDDRQVAVSLAIAELIDTDAAQSVQSARVELAIDDATNDHPDGAPVNAQQLGDRGGVGDLSEVGHISSKLP